MPTRSKIQASDIMVENLPTALRAAQTLTEELAAAPTPLSRQR